MKLLVCAQSVDTDDLALGFFVEWLEEFEKTFGELRVIALKVGAHDLSSLVFSLGKEAGRQGRIHYALRFLALAWNLRHEYDAVFVHMNQEYVLLAGWMWKFMGKRVYLWRNHYAGSFVTDIAAIFCDKIFCTSKFSYTAKYQKSVLMPVGVSPIFKPLEVARTPRSILFFGRFAPSKRPDVLLSAVEMLQGSGAQCTATFYGSPDARDEAYKRSVQVKAFALEGVRFFDGVPHEEAPKIFNAHEVFVDLSESGMYNKTIFEAAACGCLVLASSKDFAEVSDRRLSFDGTAGDLAVKLRELLALSPGERQALVRELQILAEKHSLSLLVNSLSREMSI